MCWIGPGCTCFLLHRPFSPRQPQQRQKHIRAQALSQNRARACARHPLPHLQPSPAFHASERVRGCSGPNLGALATQQVCVSAQWQTRTLPMPSPSAHTLFFPLVQTHLVIVVATANILPPPPPPPPRLSTGPARPAAPPPPATPPPPPPPGWAVLYWWPDEGWQLGRLRRRCRRAPFTHVVGYRTPTAAFAGEVDKLLNPATYGSRWVSLTRVAPSG